MDFCFAGPDGRVVGNKEIHWGCIGRMEKKIETTTLYYSIRSGYSRESGNVVFRLI